jgi:hypothetical protein
MIFNYLKIFRNSTTNTTLATRAFNKMTANDYMPELKFWIGVEEIAQIKAETYAGNNQVIYQKTSQK